jgi:hypothetical protein
MRDKPQNTGASSCLFTLRLWPEAMSGDKAELRAEVRHVQSGEVRYFRDWESLVAFLIDKTGESTSQLRVRQPIDG